VSLEVRRFRIFGELVGVSIFEDGQMDLNEFVGTPETRKNAAEFMIDYLSKLIRFIEQIYVGVLDDLKIKVPLTQQEVIKQARGQKTNH
jgi:hypothetical protein